jgi:hypothetical protein
LTPLHTSALNKRGEASGKTRLSVAAKAVRIQSYTPTERGREGERERLITSAPGRDSAMLGSPARTLLMLGSTRDHCGNDGGVASLKSKSTANSSEAALLSLGAEALAGATGAWRPAVQGKGGCWGPSFLCPVRAEVVEEMMVSALLGAHHKVEERLSHSHLNLESGARSGSDRQKRILTKEKEEEEGEGSRAVQGSGREGKGIVDRSKGVRGKGSSGSGGGGGGGGGGSSSDKRVDSREQHILGDQWISYFKQLKSYRGKHGHFSVKKGEKRSPNFRLGRWVRCVCIFLLVCVCPSEVEAHPK